jgi:hypothetical protein
MGKKAAHSGLSPKDRSINAMDKFIQRNDRKNANLEKLPARRKDPNIPINLWPLEDQIEYWESRTDVDRFMEKYPTYSSWYAAVKSASAEKFAKENPIDGIPSIAPSTAADIVPEYNTFVEVFSP